eukprot:1964535-Pyramimonas_sp.AAC.1
MVLPPSWGVIRYLQILRVQSTTSENALITVTRLSSTTWPRCPAVSDVLDRPGGRAGNSIAARSSLGA